MGTVIITSVQLEGASNLLLLAKSRKGNLVKPTSSMAISICGKRCTNANMAMSMLDPS